MVFRENVAVLMIHGDIAEIGLRGDVAVGADNALFPPVRVPVRREVKIDKLEHSRFLAPGGRVFLSPPSFLLTENASRGLRLFGDGGRVFRRRPAGLPRRAPRLGGRARGLSPRSIL